MLFQNLDAKSFLKHSISPKNVENFFKERLFIHFFVSLPKH